MGIKGRASSKTILDVIMMIANIPISGLFLTTTRKKIPPSNDNIGHGEIRKNNIPMTNPMNMQNRLCRSLEELRERSNLRV
jgi:hypothetical protein